MGAQAAPRAFQPLNAYLTRMGARDLDQAALIEKYDQTLARTLQALESIRDDEWQIGVNYPDWDPMLSESVNLERLFHNISLHFNVHAREIREAN